MALPVHLCESSRAPAPRQNSHDVSCQPPLARRQDQGPRKPGKNPLSLRRSREILRKKGAPLRHAALPPARPPRPPPPAGGNGGSPGAGRSESQGGRNTKEEEGGGWREDPLVDCGPGQDPDGQGSPRPFRFFPLKHTPSVNRVPAARVVRGIPRPSPSAIPKQPRL